MVLWPHKIVTLFLWSEWNTNTDVKWLTRSLNEHTYMQDFKGEACCRRKFNNMTLPISKHLWILLSVLYVLCIMLCLVVIIEKKTLQRVGRNLKKSVSKKESLNIRKGKASFKVLWTAGEVKTYSVSLFVKQSQHTILNPSWMHL